MSTKGSGTSPSRDLENPYKSVGSHLIDQNIINQELMLLEEAEQACKNDPEIKKEIEKANQEQEKLIQEEFDKIYDKRVVYHIFLIVFMANILINIDHGALPGCYDQIRDKLDINKF